MDVDDAAAEKVVQELFFTPEGRRDPHPHFHALRDLAPVHRSEALGTWLLTGYDDCRSAVRDPRFERRFEELLDARSPTWRELDVLQFASRTMLLKDPPEHTRLRKRVARTFTPRRVAELRPVAEERVSTLLDEFVAEGGGDLMDRVAFRLPIMIIGDLLGIPQGDLDQFRDPVIDLVGAFETPPRRELLDKAESAHAFCDAYFHDLVARRRAAPTDDLLGTLVQDPSDDPLDDQELVDLMILLFVAGFETTTNLIGNGVLALHQQPEQLALLRAEPALRANVADELLRHAATIQLVGRVTTEPVEVGGITIGAGESVTAVLGAGNRDPRRYPDPDRLDFTRTDVRPLTFGGGVHFCLGAALATMEVDVVFAELAQRFATFELDGEGPVARDRVVVRGVPSITLRVPTPAGAEHMPARPAGSDLAWRRRFRARLEADPQPLLPVELVARIRLLESHEFFAACRPSELAALAATAYPLAFEAGEDLVRQGEESPDAFVISEGEAEVAIDGEVVATLGADDLVGERGIVTSSERAATVTATSHLAALVLSRERLLEVMAVNPAAAAAMKAYADRY